MEIKDQGDGPSEPEVQPTPRKKLTIKMLMGGIVIIALMFGYFATVQRENQQILKINGELMAFLNRITPDDPSLKLVRSAISHGGGLLRTKFECKAQYSTATGHPISIEVYLKRGTFEHESRLVLSSGERTLTRPIENLESLKIDLKAEFPEAFP